MIAQDPQTPTMSDRIYILNVPSGEWKEGLPSSLTRVYCACTLVGTQFVVWGGLRAYSRSNIIQGSPMIYDLRLNQWVTKYTALSEQPTGPWWNSSLGSNSSSPETPNNKEGSGLDVARTLAGMFGVLFVMALGGVFFLYRKTKADPQPTAAAPEDDIHSKKPGPHAYQQPILCMKPGPHANQQPVLGWEPDSHTYQQPTRSPQEWE